MRNVLSIFLASLFLLSLAAVAVAGGEHCTKSASTAATAAGAGCSASAMKTAGTGCSSSMTGAHAVAIETVRMPSGALAIFYNGKNAETVAKLQADVEARGASFGCALAAGVVSNENCSVEVANTEHGILLLVTSPKNEVIDQVAAQYEVALAAHAEAPAGGSR